MYVRFRQATLPSSEGGLFISLKVVYIYNAHKKPLIPALQTKDQRNRGKMLRDASKSDPLSA
uniref:Uncharacterized protein n=1 Tax=Romanomermis culicivorax TaxID=13658 RepID=A0A915IY53_ROMCU